VRRQAIRLPQLVIAQFVPADEEAFDPGRWLDAPSGACVIALSMFQDAVFVRPAEADAGHPVYVLYHDGGDEEMVAPSLAAFVSAVRDALPGAAESR
jgi:hypothetical protein